MNRGILEGLQAHGTNCDTTCMEMLPGNHKDELPLSHFVPTLPHHFCCPVSILIYLFFLFLSSLSILNFLPPHGSFSNRLRQVHCSLWPEIYYFLSQVPNLKGLHYPGKLGQCTTAHFPGAYLGINTHYTHTQSFLHTLCTSQARNELFVHKNLHVEIFVGSLWSHGLGLCTENFPNFCFK